MENDNFTFDLVLIVVLPQAVYLHCIDTLKVCTHVCERCQFCECDFYGSMDLCRSVHMHPTAICVIRRIFQSGSENIAFGWKFVLTSIVKSDRCRQKSREKIARRKSAV